MVGIDRKACAVLVFTDIVFNAGKKSVQFVMDNPEKAGADLHEVAPDTETATNVVEINAMKPLILPLSAIAVILFAVYISAAPLPAQAAPAASSGSFTQTFSDSFDSLNTKNWSV